MVVHVCANVTQEQGTHSRDHAERDTGQVHIAVRRRVRLLPGHDDSVVERLVAGDAWHLGDLRDERGASKLDDLFDDCGGGDVRLDEGTADVFCGVRDKFVDEDVVVDLVFGC